MTTKEVGYRLAQLCAENQHQQAVEELYSPDIVSIEAVSMPEMPARREGIDAVRQKNQWWLDNHEIHSNTVKGPFFHGDRFCCVFALDCTFKQNGQRMQMKEVALYTVKDGKIVQEEFFYDVPEDCQ